MHIGVNGSFGVAHLVYDFTPMPVVSGATPLAGPLAGGRLVRLSGVGFCNTPSLTCHFGKSTTAARYVSTSAINCTTPPHAAQQVILQATNDGVGLTESNVTYTFMADGIAAAIVPSMGPLIGKINVSIFGRSLASWDSSISRPICLLMRRCVEVPTAVSTLLGRRVGARAYGTTCRHPAMRQPRRRRPCG